MTFGWFIFTYGFCGVLVTTWPPSRAWLCRNFNAGLQLRRILQGSFLISVALAIMSLALDDRALLHAAGSYTVLLGAFSAAMIAYSKRPIRGGSWSKTILAIGAHPDDLELGCGASLAKWADEGHQVHLLTLSHGAVGGNGHTRPQEALNGAGFLQAHSFTNSDIPDTQFPAHRLSLINKIEELVTALEPDLIVTHSRHDSHQDHVAAHKATLRAARRHPSIICYESPSATDRFIPNFFVDVAEYVDVKVLAVATHTDQLNKPYMTDDRVRAVVGFRGAQAKKTHAEGFEIVRLLGTSVGAL